MKYQDVLNPSYHDEYKEWHRYLFLQISNLHWSFCLLKKMYDIKSVISNSEIGFISVDIYENIFKMLIIKLYAIIYDTGSDVKNINTFKKNIIKNSIDNKRVIDILKKDKFKKHETPMTNIRNNIVHNIEKYNNDEIDYNTCKLLIDTITKLFIELSFDVEDAYIDDYSYVRDFSNKISNEFDKHYNNYFEYTLLGSKCFDSISCKINKKIVLNNNQQNIVETLNEIGISIL